MTSTHLWRRRVEALCHDDLLQFLSSYGHSLWSISCMWRGYLVRVCSFSFFPPEQFIFPMFISLALECVIHTTAAGWYNTILSIRFGLSFFPPVSQGNKSIVGREPRRRMQGVLRGRLWGCVPQDTSAWKTWRTPWHGSFLCHTHTYTDREKEREKGGKKKKSWRLPPVQKCRRRADEIKHAPNPNTDYLHPPTHTHFFFFFGLGHFILMTPK